MTNEKFQQIVGDITGRIKQTLRAKGEEYARGDRLSNFKRAASLERCSPERALRGMLTKHLISIYDMIDDLERGRPHPLRLWQEKITDAINYLILLEALLQERDRVESLRLDEEDRIP